MKKILFLMFIPIILFAQNTDKTSPMQSQQQLIWNAYEKTLEVFRVKMVSGSIAVTGIDSVEVNTEETNKLLQDMENRQVTLQDSLNALGTTQRVIRGYLNLGNVKADTANARFSVANSLLQDVEDQIILFRDSLGILNSQILIIKGYLALTNGRLDSLKNDTELMRTLLTELRTSSQIIDDWDDGANKANVNATQAGVWTIGVGVSQHTTSLDTTITISATTATQLPAITGCKEIMVTNLTSGATLRIGKDNSVATQGGIYWYGDSMYTEKEANVSKFYAYSNIETSVRISWGF